MKITLVAIDTAKDVFSAALFDESGRAVKHRKWRRAQVLKGLRRLKSCTVALEACAGSHYWAREIGRLGHLPKLIAPQHVKPYRRGQKNDRNDAVAIGRAALDAEMLFVGGKSVEQQELMALHCVRDRAVRDRLRISNQLRGILHEFGLVIPRGFKHLRGRLQLILEDAENGLTLRVRALLKAELETFEEADKKVASYDRTLTKLARESEDARRLMELRGIGPITATYLLACVGDMKVFARGRQFSAWVGVVPRQYSTGGRTRLLGISKRGDSYLRKLLIHGARAVMRHLGDKTDELSKWARAVKERRGFNKAVVALANKTARHAWAVLVKPSPAS